VLPPGFFHPASEILLGHPGIIGNQVGQIHGVVDPGVAQIERELIICLDAFLDLLQVPDLHAEDRFPCAMVPQHFPDAFRAEPFEFFDNLTCGHGRPHGLAGVRGPMYFFATTTWSHQT
jgi:hypothetical protein